MNHMKIVIVISACIFLLLIGPKGNCAVINAQSASQSDVQEAVNKARDGDTVVIPAGESYWSSEVLIEGSGVEELRSLIILGAGIDQTVITGPNPFLINCPEGKVFRLSGLTIKGGGGTDTKARIRVFGGSKAWRIDHIKFDSVNNWHITVDGHTYGLIDNCLFLGPSSVGCIAVFDTTVKGGADSWNRPLSLGSANAVYVEDCTFDFETYQSGKPCIDSRSGGRYVFRHNSVRNQGMGHHDAAVLQQRGTFSWEIHDNRFEYVKSLYDSIFMRGGTGVMFNNKFSAPVFNSGSPIRVTNYRSWDGSTQIPWAEPCDDTPEYMWSDVSGTCTTPGEVNGNGAVCVRIDGHEGGDDDVTGYPCRDQLGRTYDENGDGIQDLAPAYEWNNTNFQGNVEYDWFIRNDGLTRMHIQEGRDYFQDREMPGYDPYPYPHPLRAEHTLTPPGMPSGLKVRRVQ